MKKWRLKIIIVAALVLCFAFAFRISDKYFEIAQSLDIMASAYRDLNDYYVDSVDPSKLMQTGIEAMAQSLDPYTWYFPKDELSDLNFETTGKYGGVGISIQKTHDAIVVSDVVENGPFANAGIHTGDFILSLDDTPVNKLSMDQIAGLLKGDPGTSLNTKILHAGNDKITDYKIIRQEIDIPAVSYAGLAAPGIGYIKIGQFTEGTADEVSAAYQKIKQEHPELKGLMIDLRGNPGGLMIEALQTANLFLPQGDTIMSTRGRLPEWDHVYTADLKPMDTRIPLVVLVNGGSASASEIVAGAMQDLDRGVIVGRRSFGKGLVQTTRNLPYDTKIKFTVAKYYTPSGRCIQSIDYSQDNNEGYVSLIPDSLKKDFHTKDGRIVRSAGGIMPDKVVSKDSLSNVAGALITGDYFFDFATQYYYKHPVEPALGKFYLSEDDFNRFLHFLKDKHFTYQTGSEDALQNFRDVAKQEGSFNAIKDDYQAMYAKVKQQQNQDLMTHKHEIMQLLADEIMSRYYYQRGRIAQQLPADKVVKVAVNLLNDTTEYHQLLNN
ncbi:MAG: S41 family peptidase [Chitinophagaceae bacterium]|nr:MAG: S41 family peptidase [Chitinophagaceae bacterium]